MHAVNTSYSEDFFLRRKKITKNTIVCNRLPSLLAFDCINFMLFLVCLLFYTFFTSKSTFKLLVVSELFWISFYVIVLLAALFFDNIFILSLSFFFLMFSAAELSIGVSTFFIQKNIYQSLSVNKIVSGQTVYL